MDDGCSWSLLQRGGAAAGDELRRTSSDDDSAGLHHKLDEQEVISTQTMQQQLSQMYMLLDMEEVHGYSMPQHRVSLSSSSSSSFRTFSAGSRDDNSSLMLTAASTTTSSHHHPEVSDDSEMPFSPIAYAADHYQYSSHDRIPDMDFMYQEAQNEQARWGSGHGATAGAGAFRPYSRSLCPRKKLKPGACGQRAIKTAIATASRMHMARLAQYYQMEMATRLPAKAPAPASGGNSTQLQHVLSERKRREKLNDSFKALRTVLPCSKKDKTSVLIRAKDYVNALKSRVSELEGKNRMLVESQLHSDGERKEGNDSGDKKIEVDVSRPSPELGTLDCQEFHLKIVLRSGCSVMDAVDGILHSLKERRDVSLVAMNIDSNSGGGGAP